ncbi:MAG: phytoene desaturase [Chitinivibrionales bacterium]|nr:phytoene desaturase [Chitinivibrionales bacterium]
MQLPKTGSKSCSTAQNQRQKELRLGSKSGAPKTVAIIGAGLGGLSAAISLAAAGYQVRIFEKNKRVGGKLNVMKREGFTFDMGPSILTLPEVFRNLFRRAGKDFDGLVSIRALDTHWRCFFEDHASIDLTASTDEQKRIFAQLDPELPKRFERFLAYSREQYEIVEKPYLRDGVDTFWGMMRGIGLKRLPHVDGLRSMSATIDHFFEDQHIRDIFRFFVKYIGSSADKAPGFINLLSWVQYGFGLWYVDGGMYAVAEGMTRVLDEMGVEIRCDTEVVSLEREKADCVKGVRLADGMAIDADVVVSNMEVIPAYERLLHLDLQALKPLRRFEPTCSGLIVHLGVDRMYEQLAHHNFLFSTNQTKHFAAVFDKHELPEDPTLYLVAPARTDGAVAPAGHDNLKILPHIPYLSERSTFDEQDYMRLKERVLDKCERMGLTDLRKHIVFEHCWTPYNVRDRYYSNGGSIYGVVTDLRKNYALKAPKRSRICGNLYFVGGSVNPGGGMPMVVLSGMQTADLVRKEHAHD